MTRTTQLFRARREPSRSPALQSGGAWDSEAMARILGVFQASSRPVANEVNAYGLVGAWAAVRKVSNSVGQMMSAADVLELDGRTPVAPRPDVVADPCVGYDPFDYWREVVSHGLMRGNFIGVKLYDDGSDYATQVLPVSIDNVHGRYDETGYPVYDIGGETFARDDVVHVRLGVTVPGRIMAIGAVEAHRSGIGGQLALSKMAADVWTEGAVPSGLVQLDVANPTAEQASTVKANWVNTLGGRRTVAVIGKAMTYTPVTWSAQDAQWLESRQFSIAECALLFGLRPEDLGSSFGASSGALSYGNRSDDAIQRIADAYAPVMLPIEQAWTRLLGDGRTVLGNPESLLRSTTRERYELRQLAQSIGLETPDESRAAEGRPALDTPEIKTEES